MARRKPNKKPKGTGEPQVDSQTKSKPTLAVSQDATTTIQETSPQRQQSSTNDKRKPLQQTEWEMPPRPEVLSRQFLQQHGISSARPPSKRQPNGWFLDSRSLAGDQTAPARPGSDARNGNSRGRNDRSKSRKRGRGRPEQGPPRPTPPGRSEHGTFDSAQDMRSTASLPIHPRVSNYTSRQGPDTYGIIESTARLESDGFHPAVTLLSPNEYFEAWQKMANARIAKPSRSHLYRDAISIQGALGLQSRAFTKATLVFNPHLKMSRRLSNNASSDEHRGVVGLLRTGGVSSTLSEMVFALGQKSVKSLALSSLAAWDAVSNASNIWNFLARDYSIQGHTGVFLAVTPEYTTGEFLRARDLDPLSLSASNPVRGWYDQVLQQELDIFVSIKKVHDALLKGRTKDPLLKSMSESTIEAVKLLRHTDDIWRHRQFVWLDQAAIFEPQQRLLGNCLKTMVGQFYQKRAGIRVLHFEKTPFLDRRMLAVMLRGLPHVTMLGIYDCPLLHFGDVICILDLIHEVNSSRRSQNLLTIDSFDFYPHYEDGMPYSHPGSACYGLSWDPLRLDIVQRGIYGILLKAFMKTRAMGLGLLFERESAFRDYLFRVPNLPHGVPMFLDGLYRYADWKEGGEWARKQRKKTLFDILKAVILGIENKDHLDWAQWYIQGMKTHLTCASCGYQMPQEFFPGEVRKLSLVDCICASCTLQGWLDRQSHHLRVVKLDNLKVLFPGWRYAEFNADAPVSEDGKGILNLKTTRTTRPEHQENNSTPGYARDNKQVWDSLQGLPSLAELASASGGAELLWNKFLYECEQTDIFCRVARLLCSDKKLDGDTRLKLSIIAPTYRPDHVDERQKPKPAFGAEPQSHDFKNALELHQHYVESRWVPGIPKGLDTQSLPGFW